MSILHWNINHNLVIQEHFDIKTQHFLLCIINYTNVSDKGKLIFGNHKHFDLKECTFTRMHQQK